MHPLGARIPQISAGERASERLIIMQIKYNAIWQAAALRGAMRELIFPRLRIGHRFLYLYNIIRRGGRGGHRNAGENEEWATSRVHLLWFAASLFSRRRLLMDLGTLKFVVTHWIIAHQFCSALEMRNGEGKSRSETFAWYHRTMQSASSWHNHKNMF